jgi:hypothetical protein
MLKFEKTGWKGGASYQISRLLHNTQNQHERLSAKWATPVALPKNRGAGRADPSVAAPLEDSVGGLIQTNKTFAGCAFGIGWRV